MQSLGISNYTNLPITKSLNLPTLLSSYFKPPNLPVGQAEKPMIF